MSDLRELYQEVILDHSKNPRNFRKLETATQKAEGYNPLCGDRLMIYMRVEDGVVKDVSFEGSGCAISTASASMMTDFLKGRKAEETEVLFEAFHEMLTGDPTTAGDATGLGKLKVFAGVREFPVRVKCATLPWHTLRAALLEDEETVTTE